MSKAIGYLVCDKCGRSVPYQGQSRDITTWPQHRCERLEIRFFDRYSDSDPNAEPIGELPAWAVAEHQRRNRR